MPFASGRAPFYQSGKLEHPIQKGRSSSYPSTVSSRPGYWRVCVIVIIISSSSWHTPLFPAERNWTRTHTLQNTQSHLFPLLSFLYFINHISEYASIIFSIVESFVHKALVAYNCGWRFNGNIMQYVCKALSNPLNCCLMPNNGVHLLWISPANKGLGLQPQCIYNFLHSGQELE